MLTPAKVAISVGETRAPLARRSCHAIKAIASPRAIKATITPARIARLALFRSIMRSKLGRLRASRQSRLLPAQLHSAWRRYVRRLAQDPRSRRQAWRTRLRARAGRT